MNPVAWTVYGLSASQFGDVTDQFASGQSVREFVRSYFGFRHDFIGVAVAVVAGFGVVFAVTFAFAIKVFNYQRR